MSAYNEIDIPLEDGTNLTIQFKHGMCWLYKYHVGDRITWEHLPRPPEASGSVVVPGIGTRTSSAAGKFFAIELLDDVIASVNEIDEHEWERMMERRAR